jgi:hypothetical protein
MRVRLSSLAVVALVPSIALAQRGGGMGGMGGMGGRRAGGMGGNRGGTTREAPKFPDAKDLQKYNPAALLIDKRKKISLSDSQVTALKALQLAINERNAPLLVRYDSVRSAYRPPRDMGRDAGRGTPSPGADSANRTAMGQMRVMRSLLDSLQERRRNDVGESLDLIPDAKQKMRAAEFIDEQDRKFGEALPQMGPPDGFGRGRGRP